MSISNRQPAITYLPEKKSFLLWYELGSIRKVMANLAKQGYVHPFTKKPPSPMGVWHASLRWVAVNMDDAWENYYKESWEGDRDTWEEYLVRKMLIVYYTSEPRYLKWIEENNLQRFKHIYEHHWKPESVDL